MVRKKRSKSDLNKTKPSSKKRDKRLNNLMITMNDPNIIIDDDGSRLDRNTVKKYGR